MPRCWSGFSGLRALRATGEVRRHPAGRQGGAASKLAGLGTVGTSNEMLSHLNGGKLRSASPSARHGDAGRPAAPTGMTELSAAFLFIDGHDRDSHAGPDCVNNLVSSLYLLFVEEIGRASCRE